MREFWRRLCCRLGVHDWGYPTSMLRQCRHCGQLQTYSAYLGEWGRV